MNIQLYSKLIIVGFLTLCFNSCEEFVEVDPPKDRLIRDEVFSNDETAKSAMQGIYNQLFQAGFSNGSRNSITLLSGLSADNIQNISTTNLTRLEFEQNEIDPNNTSNLELWSSAYNMIYMTNSFLEGLEISNQVTTELKLRLEGEARFVRAFTYFYLVNLFGDVPLILTTDYRDNERAKRTPVAEVYEQILTDLEQSSELAATSYLEGERTQVTKFAALSLLARVHLYLEDWQKAEELSTQVILETGTYELQEDLNSVFLANSREAIWQISPLGGGGVVTHTNEGNLFIIDPIFSFFATTKMDRGFVESFEEEDNRLLNWIGYNASKDAYFVYKYKVRNSNQFPILEYSMALRLAEQYLIRAEARARLGKIPEAIADLDIIRERAGLALLFDIHPDISMEDLLDEIIEQRRKELFAEWGHRWLDLKRTGRVEEILAPGNTTWENTDVLYPIPAQERIKNPALNQNDGY